jgi:hypothetical protein
MVVGINAVDGDDHAKGVGTKGADVCDSTERSPKGKATMR